jgi:hypothetical protein
VRILITQEGGHTYCNSSQAFSEMELLSRKQLKIAKGKAFSGNIKSIFSKIIKYPKE